VSSHLKPVVLFVALIVGFALLLIVGTVSIEPSCSAEINRAEQQPPERDSGHQPAPESPTGEVVRAQDSAQITPQQSKPSSDLHEVHWYEKGWWKRLLCETKIGDLLLIYFTYCLVVVGGFQAYYLWEAGRISAVAANAARKSADVAEASLKDLERPWLYWHSIVPFGILPPGGAVNMYPTATTKHAPMVTCTLINIGRMPAIMGTCFYNLVLLNELPPSPVYEGGQATLKGIVQVGKTTGPIHVSMSEMTLSGEEWGAIRRNERFFFLFGYIKYSDVFGDEYTMNFGYRHYVQEAEQGFFEFGGEAYNSNRKERKKDRHEPGL